MTIKTYETAVRAGAILAAITLSGGAFGAGASGDSYSFEGGTTLGSGDLAGLTGNGTVVEETISSLPAVGRPLTDNGSHVLEIAGTVAYTNDTTSTTPSSNASQVDFMFKVEPTDELEDPTGDDIRVALAVGTNAANTTTAPIKLWCKATSGGSAGWVDLAPAAATGSWMRATLVLDYANNKCSVSLNGNPVLNGTDKWFYFVNNGGSYISSITMVGSTMVDDLLVTHTALASYEIPGGNATVAAAASGVDVTYEYMNTYGVTTNQVASDAVVNATSGMKISEKYVAGLDPTSDTKFELKTMTPTAADSATVTFPGSNDSGYTVKVTDANGVLQSSVAVTSANNTGATTAAGEDIKQATVSLPTDKLVYITVEATK